MSVRGMSHRRRRLGMVALVVVAIVALLGVSVTAFATDSQPPPPSVGANVPLTYFGPPPSTSDKELVGPVQLLRSGTVDQAAGTITLPLYQGRLKGGKTVWYILTDTTDKGQADALGLNYAPKLVYANVGAAVRSASVQKDTTLVFERGAVDFKQERKVVPGAGDSPFPPLIANPGSVGDKDYSPLVRIDNAGGQIYNAPIVAFDVDAAAISFCDGNPDYSLVHDKVVKICPEKGTVTLALISGFSFAKPVLYLSTEANDPLPAAMEGATYAPGLKDITVGHDDSAFSAVERLFAFVNGPTGTENPQRQGFNSALLGEGSPLNVLGGIPTVANDYSPLWDLNVSQWTQTAIDNGYRSRLIEEFQILGFAQQGWITGPGGAPFGSSGFIVNCPIVMRNL